jgi:XTP/dITP diphosphohydrolase
MFPILVTSNAKKADEIKLVLGPIKTVALSTPEIQSTDESAVAIDKAKKAYKIVKRPLLVEDVGLHLDCLKGFPGALIKPLLETVGVEGICSVAGKLKNRGVWAGISVVFYDGKTTKLFTQRIYGTIAANTNRKYLYKFDWNTIFIPKNRSKTLAEFPISSLILRKAVYTKVRLWLQKNNQADTRIKKQTI